MINMPDCINKIFEKVKYLTGKNVELIEKKDLNVYASIKIARKSMPSHLMYYKPEYTGMINHLIAHECGHILRIYSVNPEDRVIPFSNDQIRLKALRDIEPEAQRLLRTLPYKEQEQIKNFWYAGMVRQLTVFPSDIQIEKWIYDEYPDLRQYQSQQIKRQYDEAVQVLSAQAERLTPRKLLKASNGMNYVFFSTLGAHFNDTCYLRKYDKSAYADIGKKLALLQEGAGNNYKGDIDTVNKWAEVLELSHWFSWMDFENIPSNYLKDFS